MSSPATTALDSPEFPDGERDGATWSSLLRRLHRFAREHRTPIAGSLALTHRCNLRCVHCYLQHDRARAELAAEPWQEILDQLHAAGCLWLVLSGGEPLLRSDFAPIYQHAKDRGFLVTLFTNGTQIDDPTLALLAERPPLAVEISLYGYSAETYGTVTGEAGARDRAFAAVERLLREQVVVRLKAMVLRQNVHELAQLRDYSRARGLPFRCDTMITPCLDGSPKPCATRLEEQHILELDLTDETRFSAWSACLSEEYRQGRGSLYECGAGVTSFHVDPSGGLSPCVSDAPLFDLTQGRFVDGWNGVVRERREQPLPEGHPCLGCRDQNFCGVCPPVARMETGNELGLPAELCRLGKQRRQAVQTRLESPAEWRGRYCET